MNHWGGAKVIMPRGQVMTAGKSKLHLPLRAAIFLVVSILLTWTNASAQAILKNDSELDRIDIEEHLGEKVGGEHLFTDDLGNEVRFGDYLNQGKPVVLVLGYYSCPMLCNLVFNGLTDVVNQMDWIPGEKFQIITASINPKDGFELARAKKENYLAAFERNIPDSGWAFLVGEEDQSAKLAEEIGFKYFLDSETGEYAHAAAVYVLTEEGVISRYLYGIQFNKTDFKLALLEASEGRIGNTVDRLILYCYRYDPNAGGYVLMASNVMKLGGGAALLLLVLLLTMLWWGERMRKKKNTSFRPTKSGVNI